MNLSPNVFGVWFFYRNTVYVSYELEFTLVGLSAAVANPVKIAGRMISGSNTKLNQM